MNKNIEIMFELIDYADVWGNDIDGYDVNIENKVTDIVISNNDSDEDILNMLIEIGYLNDSAMLDVNIYMEDFGEFIEFYSEIGLPLCRLQKKY